MLEAKAAQAVNTRDDPKEKPRIFKAWCRLTPGSKVEVGRLVWFLACLAAGVALYLR